MIHICEERTSEKIVGFDDICERAQTWRAAEHSKNTWFIDSSGAPHLAQHISPCIPRDLKFFFTAIHPDTSCHKKCLIFGGHRTFQQWAFKRSTVGPNTSLFFLIWINPLKLVSWFHRISSILCEIPFIPIHHLGLTKWDAFYDFRILGIHQCPNCLRIPSSRNEIYKSVHCKVWVTILLIFICWSRASG